MKFLGRVSFLVLATGMALAQTSAPSSGQGNDPSLADQVKALQAAMAAQQAQIARQQEKIDNQQQKIDGLEKTLSDKTSGAAHVEDAALITNTAPTTQTVQGDQKPKESPLSVRIGGTEFTPGGFVDFENVFRSTNTGFVTATSFWAIPFSNAPNGAGHLTEYRATGQYSRFNLKITGKYGINDVTGYIEGDFNGNDAANVFVSSNPHTLRMRLYWLDLKREKWEFLAGSTWGLQTPNRVGVSPNPADVFVTIGNDAQTHVGINYTRAAEFRAAYHFNDNWVWAAALQNPQQFIGQGNEVAFPTQFSTGSNATLPSQLDNGTVPGAPNVFPDVITKAAYDNNFSGRHLHFELGGLMTTVKVNVIPTVAGATFKKHGSVGGGLFAGINAELIKNFRFVASGMWGAGVGRYLIGMGPQAVIVPVAATSGGTCLGGALGGCDAHISPVHSGDAILGFEMQPWKNTLWGTYYGGAYFQRNAFPDLTSTAVIKPVIGFGAPGAPAAGIMNRAIQEATFDWTQTFWRNPQYGAVVMVTQTSYVTRAPWFVTVGSPKNAHLMMGYLSLRYVLP